jgi:hypothetical protein
MHARGTLGYHCRRLQVLAGSQAYLAKRFLADRIEAASLRSDYRLLTASQKRRYGL